MLQSEGPFLSSILLQFCIPSLEKSVYDLRYPALLFCQLVCSPFYPKAFNTGAPLKSAGVTGVMFLQTYKNKS